MLNPDKTAANVAIVQNCYALFGAGDVAGLLAQLTDDVHWEPVGDRNLFPLFGAWTGKDGVAAFLTKMAATLQFTAFEPREFYGSGDKVFAMGTYTMHMFGSGQSATANWTMVFALRDGLVADFREYTDGARIVAVYRGTEEANIALVQQIYADFAKGDVAAILGTMDPAIEWISGGSREDFPTLGKRVGIEDAASFFRDVAEHDEFTSFEPREFVAMGDKVAVIGHYGITAKRSGKHFESDWAHVFTVRNGKGVKFQEFTDTAAFYKSIR
jgi:ketosteroid isomerase-like protein